MAKKAYVGIEDDYFYNSGSGSLSGGIGSKARSITKMYVGVPKKYKKLEYVEFSGNQYVDTGVFPFKTKAEIKFSLASLTSQQNSWIVACTDSFNDRYYTVAVKTTSGTATSIVCAPQDNTTITLSSSPDSNEHIVIYNDENNKVLYDGVEKSTIPDLTRECQGPLRIGCLGNSSGSTQEYYKNGRVHYVKVTDKETNTLIRHFVPAKDENDVACLFDLVENKVYYSKSSTALIAGPVVPGEVFKGESFARLVTFGYVGDSSDKARQFWYHPTHLPAPANTLMLTHFDGNAFDEVSQANCILTAGNIDSASSSFITNGKFGGACYYYGNYYTNSIPAISDFINGTTGEYTFSAYVRLHSGSTSIKFGVGHVHYRGTSIPNSYSGLQTKYSYTDGTVYITGFELTDYNNIMNRTVSITPIAVDNDWHRVAFYMTGLTIDFYYDGSVVGSMNVSDIGTTASNRYSPGTGNEEKGFYASYCDVDEVLVCEGLGGQEPLDLPYYIP